jgi:hypothetical protein
MLGKIIQSLKRNFIAKSFSRAKKAEDKRKDYSPYAYLNSTIKNSFHFTSIYLVTWANSNLSKIGSLGTAGYGLFNGFNYLLKRLNKGQKRQ